MKKILMVLMMMMVAVATFADAKSKAEAAMEKAKVECQEAWDEWYNCEMMSFEEFTAEYKKNHFAPSSSNLSKAFKEYQEEVRQKQKELKAVFEEASAKEDKATQVWLDAMDAEMAEAEKLQAEIDAEIEKLQAEIDEL